MFIICTDPKVAGACFTADNEGERKKEITILHE